MLTALKIIEKASVRRRLIKAGAEITEKAYAETLDYDIVLVDTHHLLDEMTLVALDSCYMSAFIVTNDLVDLKNMKR